PLPSSPTRRSSDLIADIALDETESGPGIRAHIRGHLIQIVLMAGGEVVQPDHLLARRQQRLQEVGANETGTPGHQPATRLRLQTGHRFLEGGCGVRACCHVQTGSLMTYRRRSASSAVSTYFRSYSTCSGLP